MIFDNFKNLNNDTINNGLLFNSKDTLKNDTSLSLKNESVLNSSEIMKEKLLDENPYNMLKNLLNSAHNLPTDDDLEFGILNLTPKELQRKSERMRKNDLKYENKGSKFTKAYYLLASSGISAEDIENEISSIESMFSDSSFPSNILIKNIGHKNTSFFFTFNSNDVENYLSFRKDESISSSIEKSLELASNDFDNFISSKISTDWKEQCDSLRQSIELNNFSDITNNDEIMTKFKKYGINNFESLKKSLILNDNTLFEDSFSFVNHDTTTKKSQTKQVSRERFENYVNIIQQHNEDRLNNVRFPLFLNFFEITKHHNDLKSRQMSQVWKILINLTNENFSVSNDEQSFFESYQGDSISDNSASYYKSKIDLNMKIVRNGRSHFEIEFYNYIKKNYLKKNKVSLENIDDKNTELVLFYINDVVLKNKPKFLDKILHINEIPIWVLIFYFMRAGLYKEALDYTYKNKDLFNKFDKSFFVYFKSFVESENHILPDNFKKRIDLEFSQQFQYIIDEMDFENINFDIYKYSVYKIVGKCNLGKKKLINSIFFDIETWLWFHLSIINEYESNDNLDMVFGAYKLKDLQNKIISLGPKYFNVSLNNPLYLTTLVVIGLYELAVSYVYESISECDSVHLAIGLNYHGLLKISNFDIKKNTSKIINENNEINFFKLIFYYVKPFNITDPVFACHYLMLLAMTKGNNLENKLNKCHDALRDLILISKNFFLLTGELDFVTGNKKTGILEKFRSLIKLSDLNDYRYFIFEKTALICEEEGRFFEAISLYGLCLDFDSVFRILNKLLAEIILSINLSIKFIDKNNTIFLNDNCDIHLKSDNLNENKILTMSKSIIESFDKKIFDLNKILIKKKNTCFNLLEIIKIKEHFVAKDWNQVYFEIEKLDLISISPENDLIQIRKASNLVLNNEIDDNILKVIPSILIMAMVSIFQINILTVEKKYQSLTIEKQKTSSLKDSAKNCMIYAGIIQSKIPKETYCLLVKLESFLIKGDF